MPTQGGELLPSYAFPPPDQFFLAPCHIENIFQEEVRSLDDSSPDISPPRGVTVSMSDAIGFLGFGVCNVSLDGRILLLYGLSWRMEELNVTVVASDPRSLGEGVSDIYTQRDPEV